MQRRILHAKALRWIVAVSLLAVSPTALAQDGAGTEAALRERADIALNQGDHAAAVEALEAMVRGYPASRDEQVFWDLGKICDTYGYDFDKAMAAYRLYAERFPNGRFAVRFRDRLAWLQAHRQDWSAVKSFIAIQSGAASGSPNESLRLATKLAEDNPTATVRPDIAFWLAGQLDKLGRVEEARVWAEDYLASFPANGKNRASHVQALELCSKIAAKQRDFPAAKERLERIASVDPARTAEFQKNLAEVRFQQRAWWGMIASAASSSLLGLGALSARPWRLENFGAAPKRVAALMSIVVLLTAVPYAILRAAGERVPWTFLALSGFGCVGVLLIWLAAPLHKRIGRPAFLAASTLFMLAVVYAAFYLTGTASVLRWLTEEFGRHSG